MDRIYTEKYPRKASQPEPEGSDAKLSEKAKAKKKKTKRMEGFKLGGFKRLEGMVDWLAT